jgi:hypothetical protein
MKKVIVLTVATFLTAISSNAYAVPRPPELMKISITRKTDPTGFRGIKAFFQWPGDAPAFDSNQAVEFEVIIMTDKPKCFGQPLGGKDNNVSHAQSNLPDYYTDVWNYYWPSDPLEVIADLRANCGAINGWCNLGIQAYNPDRSDDHANFAVGSRRPDLIKVNKTYYLQYPLEIPNDPECHEYDNGLAWVQINMTLIPNTCTKCGSVRTCPHFLGYPDCPEYKIFRESVDEGEECKSIIKRLCAPTIEYTFSPYDIGFSDIACGGEEGGGVCIDEDEDGFFALFKSSSGSWIPMFGSHTGDCDDDAVNIDNSNYNPGTGICTTLIDPPVDPCATVTSGNGYYCGSNEELADYFGDDEDLVYCQNGMTFSIDYCEDGCQQNSPGYDDECINTSCTPICNPGQTQCNGNNVEVCSADQCSYEFSYSCGSNQTCMTGSCVTTTVPKPEINSVSCTSYFRGDTNVTCTVYGSNFDCGFGANAFIANFYNGPAQSCSSTQFTVSGNWVCNQELGFKQVSYRNPDNQRDDRADLLELQMGELTISDAWQQTVHEGATNVPMGANGCNFGTDVVLFVEGIAITNTHLQTEDQVLGNGEVTWPAGSPPSMLCVAKYSGASIGFDKKCLYGYVTIIP